MVSIARWITVIVGFYSTYFIYEAFNILEQDEFATLDDIAEGVIGSVLLLFLHLGAVIIAFPFMFYSVVAKDKIPKWFAIVLAIESILNAIFMWFIIQPFRTEDRRTVIFVVFELLPAIML